MKVLAYYDTWTVGLTATPCRLDGSSLGAVYGALVVGVDTRWLIDHQRLAPYIYYAPTLVDTTGLRTIAGDYVVSDLEQLMNERAIYGDILTTYQKLAPGEQTICYCVSVAHAKRTADVFNRAAIRAAVLSAGTPARQRQAIMDDFRAGAIQILCNVGIISEGISIDEVSCVILARPTESVALGIQQMMRCMRYLPGKTAKIIDVVGNLYRIGLPDDDRAWSLDKPMRKRRELNSEGNFYIRSCPECYMVFPTAPKCPFCGTEYPLHPREIQAHQEIELQRISEEEAVRINEAKKKSRIEQGRAQSFEELVRLGKQRGYKNPAFWAAQVLRGRKR
jgi:superfamily II DNA or RNA helicase